MFVCFNGAVTLSLQKFDFRGFSVVGDGALQWSCNFIVTEICVTKSHTSPSNLLQWSCNFIVTEIWLGQFGKW